MAATFASARTPTDPLNFVYGEINGQQGVALNPNSVYYLLDEPVGNDGFYDDMQTVVASTNVGSITGSVYTSGGHLNPGGGSKNHMYGPVNFLYMLSGG